MPRIFTAVPPTVDPSYNTFQGENPLTEPTLKTAVHSHKPIKSYSSSYRYLISQNWHEVPSLCLCL